MKCKVRRGLETALIFAAPIAVVCLLAALPRPHYTPARFDTTAWKAAARIRSPLPMPRFHIEITPIRPPPRPPTVRSI
jgi:hypothetical protein